MEYMPISSESLINAEDPEIFRQYHRLDIESFNKVLKMVGPIIQNQETIMRASISPGERLSITLRFLATEDWLKIADEFKTKWNYPCCLGALDGKHIAIQQPQDSGSEFVNYKHIFSVLLLALVDANYKFVYVDVGASGRAGDTGVFGESSLKKVLGDGTLNLPPPITVEGIPSKICYHIVGDDAFQLTENIMKP
ncbi:Hypothetical predicted protein [Paramuricea clavata]|uniref:Uncharacterized protein n=1 Tax=Paramuricea clavata TaxID=317549 RepID=A0A6S7G0I6_PARCT|nr:Hypothetical predicted protein [Paramuricea clavata]